MKKLILVLSLIASTHSFADVSGVIGEAQCSAKSGRGFLELKSAQGNELVSTWHKVESTKLCSTAVESRMLLGRASQLDNISAENSISKQQRKHSIVLDDNGNVVDILDDGFADTEKMANVDSYKHINREEVQSWYFGIPNNALN